MAIITLPPDIVRQLREAGGKALLCDDNGHPVGEAGPPPFEIIGATRAFSAEEWAEAKRTGEWVRLADLVAELKGQ